MKGCLITLELMDIEKHAKGYFEISQDPKLHEYVGNTIPKNIEEIKDLLGIYDELLINWMIIDRQTNRIIGIMRLSKPVMENNRLEAGESQRLHSNYWRKGHMKEAKALFYNHVFNELGVDVLYADVYEGNVNSIRSLESYGYKLIEVQKGIFKKADEEKKIFIYKLTKLDYLNR
ncbi:MAG: GNAT family N-acetyltransferase [Clostridiales bacterium]|nr:GNAT family N-acetyltransferase [Clostridiales bacterium]